MAIANSEIDGEVGTVDSPGGPSEERVELLRFLTAGSVDDGKSTLIGRLLYDSKSIFEDQLTAIKDRYSGEVNLANLTDGLRAEREQGITIDVAYRYFATPRRRFIIADAPGHVQYTRNMVTAASTANCAVLLVDARNGVTEQTRRHAFIVSLLRIPHILLCINKMDLVDYSERRFHEIRDEFSSLAAILRCRDVNFIPICATDGDNVVEASSRMPWYKGGPVLEWLEEVHISNDRNLADPRFSVQWVIRPRDDDHHDFRGYAGQITSGVFRKGGEIVVLPSGLRSRIKAIHCHDQEYDAACAPMSVAIELEDKLDVGRGDLLASPENAPMVRRDCRAWVCWMQQDVMTRGGKYLVKHATNTVQVRISAIEHKVDIRTLEEVSADDGLAMNEIGKVRFESGSSLMFDPYRRNRHLGGFILIDPTTNMTAGVGLLLEPEPQLPTSLYQDYVI